MPAPPYDRLAAMERRLDEFVKMSNDAHEAQQRILDGIRKIAEKSLEASQANALHLVDLEGKMMAMADVRAVYVEWLKAIDLRGRETRDIAQALQLANAGLQAEKGVWASILRSPLVAWLAAVGAALAAVWALLTQGGHGQ